MNAYPELDRRLKACGIDTTEPGFDAYEAFQKAQAADPSLIDTYAEWVRLRPRTAAYDAYVRQVVPRLSEIIVAAFKADDCHGWCVAASTMMSRMLDRLGIWNYGVLGSTTFEVASAGICCGFYRQDFEDFQGVSLGHAWLCAPPYTVVDPTVALQLWGNDPVVAYLPPYVASESVKVFTPKVLDVVSYRMWDHHAFNDGHYDDQLHLRLKPELASFGKMFPATAITHNMLEMRYVPSRIHASSETLETMTTDGAKGRSGADIWAKQVRAILSDTPSPQRQTEPAVAEVEAVLCG